MATALIALIFKCLSRCSNRYGKTFCTDV